jgi:hypothetical protein
MDYVLLLSQKHSNFNILGSERYKWLQRHTPTAHHTYQILYFSDNVNE